MILVNIAGHSTRAKGARAYNGKYEHDYTRGLQQRVTKYAPSFWNVREECENMALRDVINFVGEHGYGIDIHFNNNNPLATGVEVFVNPHTSAKNKLIASLMVSKVANVLGLPVRRIQSNRSYKYSHESHRGRLAIVDNTKIPFILLEVCFLNAHDLPIYEQTKDEVAKAIIEAYGIATLGDLDPKTEKRV